MSSSLIALIDQRLSIDLFQISEWVFQVDSLLGITARFTLAPNPYWFWFASGIGLCTLEFLLPKSLTKRHKLIALMPGICALILSFLLFRTSRSVLFQVQIVYWMALSTASVIWLRPMLLRKPKKYIVPEATEAKTLTEILPGEMGRVLYEGCNWQAYCQDSHISIAANQTVYVLRREGNSLIIIPKSLFQFVVDG